MHTGTGSAARYWGAGADGSVVIAQATAPADFPFEFVAVNVGTAISDTADDSMTAATVCDLQGRTVGHAPRKGVYIVKGKKVVR